MAFLGGLLGDLVSPVTDIIGKAVVDKDKKKELEYKLKELIDKADQRYHEELIAQTEINKVEAAHASVFVAGWRPFIGWISGTGLGYHFIVSPILETILKATGWYTEALPELDTPTLMTLVLAMLGVGAQRSFDKYKGVDTKSVRKGA